MFSVQNSLDRKKSQKWKFSHTREGFTQKIFCFLWHMNVKSFCAWLSHNPRLLYRERNVLTLFLCAWECTHGWTTSPLQPHGECAFFENTPQSKNLRTMYWFLCCRVSKHNAFDVFTAAVQKSLCLETASIFSPRSSFNAQFVMNLTNGLLSLISTVPHANTST
jgi:hypothetical protein